MSNSNNHNGNHNGLKIPKTILVLEDEQPLAEVIKKELELQGLLAVIARTADQGMAYLNEVSNIAAIWIDHYLLGSKDGATFLAEVRSSGKSWSTLPVFVITNTGSPEKIDVYKKMDVVKFFTKANHKLKDIIKEIVNYLK